MSRVDFSLLTDDEIRNALDVAACKLCEKLWPKLVGEFAQADYSQFFDACKLRLAKNHGIEEVLTTEAFNGR